MTIKQAKLVKKIAENGGTITGREMREIGYSEHASHNPGRYTTAKSVQNQLRKALKKHGITINNAIKPIGEALNAEKTDKDTGEVTTDHTTRLKASAMALKLLKIDDMPVVPQTRQPQDKELAAAMQSSDEIELQRIAFRKTDDETKTVQNPTKQ